MFDNRPPTPWRDEPDPWREPARDPALERTQPILPAPPTAPLPPRRTRGADGLVLVLIGALIGGAVGIGGARALTPQLFPGSAPSSAAAAPAGTTTAADPAAQAAIANVIQQANAAQATAFAKHDPTVMQATSTAAHYAEMVQVNNDLAAAGVTSIALVNMSVGAVSVSGSTATATTTETWTSTLADGSTYKSTDENHYTLVLSGGAWKISGNTQASASGTGTGITVPTPAPNPQAPTSGVVQGTSRNWSGYVATGGTYTSVTGTWVIAKPDQKTPGVDATWVGIGGAHTTDLIQAGTGATVNPDGTVAYDAWTETLPQSARTVALTVNAGDTVTVTLTEESAGSWSIEMKNVTTNKTYTTTLGYNSSKSSAEWIMEAPSIGRTIAPLDSFGTVKFSAASTVVDGTKQTLKAAGAKPVTMTNSGSQPLAIPTAIGADGSSFNVDRTSTPSTGGGTGSPGRRRG
jgi:hypothetical protein